MSSQNNQINEVAYNTAFAFGHVLGMVAASLVFAVAGALAIIGIVNWAWPTVPEMFAFTFENVLVLSVILCVAFFVLGHVKNALRKREC